MSETANGRLEARATGEEPRIVVLGVGNLLCGDEGVGVRVLRELAARYHVPGNVTLVDAGTAGLRVLFLMDGADRVVVVDAVDVGAPAGTVVRLQPEEVHPPADPVISNHEAGPLEALAVLGAVTGRAVPAVIVGVQPGDVSPWNDRLSGPVSASLPLAVEAVVEELAAAGVAVTPRASGGQPNA
jgi:hydrogenase maturation protease